MMTSREEKQVCREAEGFVMLAMYEDARNLVETLAGSQEDPEVLRIRLACAMGEEQWGIAHELARVLAAGCKTDAIFAARVLREVAAIEYLSGRKELAETIIATALAAHPEERTSFLEDPHLKHLFQ